MLIRSQDNEILINLDRIGAIAKSKDNHIVASESVMPRPSEILDLGEYSTEAKAIKVLDMIQAHKNTLRITSLGGGNIYDIKETFQMPQDEEKEE